MEVLAPLLAPEGGLRRVPDPRKGRSGNIAMADFGLSAFAMIFMQSASFLSIQRTLEKGQGRSNCQTLFGIEKNSFRQFGAAGPTGGNFRSRSGRAI